MVKPGMIQYKQNKTVPTLTLKQCDFATFVSVAACPYLTIRL